MITAVVGLDAQEVADAIVGEARFVIGLLEFGEIVLHNGREAAGVWQRERTGAGIIGGEMKSDFDEGVFGKGFDLAEGAVAAIEPITGGTINFGKRGRESGKIENEQVVGVDE